MSASRGVCTKSLGWVQLFCDPHLQGSPWSALLCPPQGDLLNLRIEPMSPESLALAGAFFTTSATRKPPDFAKSGFIFPKLWNISFILHGFRKISQSMCVCFWVFLSKEQSTRMNTEETYK